MQNSLTQRPRSLTPLTLGKTDKPKRATWLEKHCQQLKHKPDAVETLIREMGKLTSKKSLTKTYLLAQSGVTEATCKTLVKQRLCGQG